MSSKSPQAQAHSNSNSNCNYPNSKTTLNQRRNRDLKYSIPHLSPLSPLLSAVSTVEPITDEHELKDRSANKDHSFDEASKYHSVITARIHRRMHGLPVPLLLLLFLHLPKPSLEAKYTRLQIFDLPCGQQ